MQQNCANQIRICPYPIRNVINRSESSSSWPTAALLRSPCVLDTTCTTVWSVQGGVGVPLFMSHSPFDVSVLANFCPNPILCESVIVDRLAVAASNWIRVDLQLGARRAAVINNFILSVFCCGLHKTGEWFVRVGNRSFGLERIAANFEHGILSRSFYSFLLYHIGTERRIGSTQFSGVQWQLTNCCVSVMERRNNDKAIFFGILEM